MLSDTFTTGTAAKVAHLSQQSIIRACDTGVLQCFKVPGSTHRRIPRHALIRFMCAHGIPFDMLTLTEQEKALVEGLTT